jgi:hypothetical protein
MCTAARCATFLWHRVRHVPAVTLPDWRKGHCGAGIGTWPQQAEYINWPMRSNSLQLPRLAGISRMQAL